MVGTLVPFFAPQASCWCCCCLFVNSSRNSVQLCPKRGPASLFGHSLLANWLQGQLDPTCWQPRLPRQKHWKATPLSPPRIVPTVVHPTMWRVYKAGGSNGPPIRRPIAARAPALKRKVIPPQNKPQKPKKVV